MKHVGQVFTYLMLVKINPFFFPLANASSYDENIPSHERYCRINYSHTYRRTIVTWLMHLLVILFLLAISTALGGLGLLSADTTGTATTERRIQSEVDVLLGVKADDERGDVDDLLANTDVALADEDTGMVDSFGKTELEDASLKAALQEILDLQGKHVIELHAGLVEDTNADETANEGIAFKETLGVLFVKGQELTSSTTNLGQSQTDSPDLTLISEAILANELQLRVPDA